MSEPGQRLCDLCGTPVRLARAPVFMSRYYVRDCVVLTRETAELVRNALLIAIAKCATVDAPSFLATLTLAADEISEQLESQP